MKLCNVIFLETNSKENKIPEQAYTNHKEEFEHNFVTCCHALQWAGVFWLTHQLKLHNQLHAWVSIDEYYVNYSASILWC